jgi:hypothetical protein
MTAHSRVYTCNNPDCHQYNVKTKIFGQLNTLRFYSWPNLTCTGCGRPPRLVEGSPPVVEPVSSRMVKRVSSR